MVTRARNVLGRKLWRDMRRSAMQFVAIVLLCALGTWVYSGLDGAWRMIELSSETYFAQTNLADLWVYHADVSRDDVDALRAIPGVKQVQSRFTAELDVPALGEDVSLLTHAYQGAPAMNTPLVLSGAALRSHDRRGLLLDEKFAQAHGLAVGDRITLRLNAEDRTFVIRGLALSSEQVMTVKDVTPDPARYGYAIVNLDAFAQMPLNQVLMSLSPGADATLVEKQAHAALPEAMLVTQRTQASTQRTRSEAAMFRNLTYIFPTLTFLVAAMMVLSTLTRMIENQRTQIGTLKALGYSRRKIRTHYLYYALVPSLLGSLGGLFVGHLMLPDMLYAMETTHFILPEKLRPPISLPAWGMAGLMVLLSVAICLYTYRRAAREEAAALLRPKPPKAGSRVLLERWGWLWRKLSFNAKMVVRNVARNKGRTALAMVGLLCCNMLIICAIGLQDSVDACVGGYYQGTVDYDLRADLDADAGTLQSYQNRLEADRVEGVMEKQVSLHSPHDTRVTLLTVLQEDQRLLRLGKGNTVTPLPAAGVAISRKLAEVTGLAAGDPVQLWLPGDDTGISFTVAQVLEVNVGQSVYMSAAVWEALHKGAFQPTGLLLKAPTALTRHQLSQADEVTALKDPHEQYRRALSILDSTTAVFSLMYGAALGLAFVICYNMGLISFTEHTRDYATLKVLGYHQKEIRGLMMWENNLITLIGAALGIGPGVLLTQAVLATVQTENYRFMADIPFTSILFATVITCLFSVFIEWMLTRKVRTINMVEALKSVE